MDTFLYWITFSGSGDISQGVSWTYGAFSQTCFNKTQAILKEQNLPADNLMILPMKRPPNCFYPQKSFNINPLDIYCSKTPAGYPYFDGASVSSTG